MFLDLSRVCIFLFSYQNITNVVVVVVVGTLYKAFVFCINAFWHADCGIEYVRQWNLSIADTIGS